MIGVRVACEFVPEVSRTQSQIVRSFGRFFTGPHFTVSGRFSVGAPHGLNKTFKPPLSTSKGPLNRPTRSGIFWPTTFAHRAHPPGIHPPGAFTSRGQGLTANV